MDIEQTIDLFYQDRQQGIYNICQTYLDISSIQAFKEEIKPELIKGCHTFIEKKYPINEINNYLFYIFNAYCRKIANPVKKHAEYVCPACILLNKDFPHLPYKRILSCFECENAFKVELDPSKQVFFKTFSKHNKNGYRCPDCKRFIPHPLNNSKNISCPYFDCIFVGQISNLSRMNHPTTNKFNPESLILDNSDSFSLKNNILDNSISLETIDNLKYKIKAIKKIIEEQSNSITYNSSNSTIIQKKCVYQAFSNLLNRYPAEMTSYLLETAHDYFGFQHKLFQEFIFLLEQEFPFFITKNKKHIKIDNLLDKNLFLFDGISVFEGIINEKLIVKNNTQEFYIGGRKASYTKPYYIGKLLNIIDQNKNTLIENVLEYTFNKIYLSNVKIGNKLIITHLRIPPHNQMGGMSHINRIKKKISEKAKSLEFSS